MPRDDLSIDFVRRMPLGEPLDPALILDDWINRVQNLPEEIRFIQDEIADKDRQFNECIKTIEERDNRIQKWIKTSGSHEPNPKEAGYRNTIRENYAKADQLAADKILLAHKMQLIMDKHIRNLDVQIKLLYDRNEPGFTDPDELPSLLRASAANTTQPPKPISSSSPVSNSVTVATPLNPIVNSAAPTAAARAPNPQVRSVQSQPHNSASAPATPAASMLLNRQVRETSAGPSAGAPKRGPRSNSGLGNLPTTSSGLARHSSLGPGTPKHHTATGVPRAGSAGPRATTKGAIVGPGRKASTPLAVGPGRKKTSPAGASNGTAGPPNKSELSRVKRPAKNSPSSTADSDLSDADSHSGDESDARTGGRGTPAARAGSHPPELTASRPEPHPPMRRPHGHGRPGGMGGGGPEHTKDGAGDDGDEEDGMDVDDDDGGDDKKYCLCQNVSFGDMVACDNDACPFEWFHWSCVGLKSEPNGTWYCPVCTENMKKKAK